MEQLKNMRDSTNAMNNTHQQRTVAKVTLSNSPEWQRKRQICRENSALSVKPEIFFPG